MEAESGDLGVFAAVETGELEARRNTFRFVGHRGNWGGGEKHSGVRAGTS